MAGVAESSKKKFRSRGEVEGLIGRINAQRSRRAGRATIHWGRFLSRRAAVRAAPGAQPRRHSTNRAVRQGSRGQAAALPCLQSGCSSWCATGLDTTWLYRCLEEVWSFYFKQKTASEIPVWLEFRRVFFR